jgi:hypothetical protein
LAHLLSYLMASASFVDGVGVRARFGPFIIVLDSVCAGTGVRVPVGAVLVLGCSSFDLSFALARSLF